MKYLKIVNDGVLDIRLVALMGGTTKANDRYKIGQFGTGLKYSLAYLFRNNIDFKIYCGPNEAKISLEKETINDSEFEIICVNGHRTSITTSMGHQWNSWMIIRELWCNALDEGGEDKAIVEDTAIAGAEGKTTFYIQLLPEIQQVLENWKKYFIHEQEPLWENDEYGIYINNTHGKLKLYKHGVLIYEHPEIESLFYYDIKGATINELREFRGSTSYEIFNALSNPSQDVINYFFQHIKEDHYEGSEMDYNWFVSFASVWKDALSGKKIAKTGDYEYYRESGVEVDFTNVVELPKKVYKALVKDFEGIGVSAATDDKSEFYEIPVSGLPEKVTECCLLLKSAGYVIDPDIKFKFGVFRDVKQMASVSRKKNSIMLSEFCLKIQDDTLCEILIENNEYITTGYEKEAPAYYRRFVNLYTRALLAKHSVEV